MVALAKAPACKIEELPIFCYYDKQRFTQFGSMDCANWYGIQVESGKKQQALYPAMGRQHVTFLEQNRLVFSVQPRAIYKSIRFFYVFDGTTVYQYDNFYNFKVLPINTALGGPIWFATLAVGTTVYNLVTDGVHIFVITENGSSVTAELVTDPNAPGGATTGGSPLYVAAFGNRFVVSKANTPEFYLTQAFMARERQYLFYRSGTRGCTQCISIRGNRSVCRITKPALYHVRFCIRRLGKYYYPNYGGGCDTRVSVEA